MTLIAFLQAQNCSNYVGSWRHPASMTDFLSPQYYQRIARTLEDARFDMAFFDDRLAMPEIYGNSPDLAVEHGIRSVKMDPTAVLMAMAMATSHLGLGATYSTTYYEPFHVARLFATLDHMTGGRVAWNIVTSLNDSEAANFGRSMHLEHDERYDRADEFVEIVEQMWTSWEPGALVVDKETGRFADPAKVHATQYQGKFFDVHGTARSRSRSHPRGIRCCCKPAPAAAGWPSRAAGPTWCSPRSATSRPARRGMRRSSRPPPTRDATRTS